MNTTGFGVVKIACRLRINEYDASKEEWLQYAERVDHFFAANVISGHNRASCRFKDAVHADYPPCFASSKFISLA